MILYPNGKINVGLNILKKRADEYHDISSILYPLVDLFDILEIIPSASFSFTSSGILLPDKEENICEKAFYIIYKKFNIPPVSIHLHKQIPIGSGLGGGSSDAAFTLKGLNIIFNLGMTTSQLEYYAASLGADCPFFINNTPRYVEGIGDELYNLSLDLDEYEIRLEHSNIHISTSEAYKDIILSSTEKKLKDLIILPIDEWKNNIKNDFESSIFKKFPELLKKKQNLYNKGAVYCSLTGSGATVYGIFRKT